MKLNTFILFILIGGITQAQTNFTISAPQKVEDYSYGELNLKLIPFGLGKKIPVGKLLADGTIQFNWPEIIVDSIKNASVFMSSLKSNLVGMSYYCEKDQMEENSKDCKVVDSQYIYLYKNSQQVGILFPATERAFLDNEPANMYGNLTLGSSLSWFYSDGDCNFKANCSEQKAFMDLYDFKSQSNFDVHLKKGWNIVQFTLAEIEEFKGDNNAQGKVEKKISKKSIDHIPENIKWHIKTFVKLD